ncbi:MAG TPA: ATP-binding cassette domain-containing protein [Syntrophales bacterium]|nr:ATP-binding cassette domain-containing protein [Syntrophales bacterium]HQN78741.1 ATP-binding cassette domain-containing protein [Syntrophales bacterium]HQQ27121.1 ATP-binding cassette domain-containing protein [Syntrophales bacterium]
MIHVESLTKYYGKLLAVNGISFDIRRGEVLGLLGPNGAGKTTTLRMLTGYLAPTSGTIRIGDLTPDRDLVGIKKKIGYLPESAPLYKDMLVHDYLLFAAGIREMEREARLSRMKELARLCGINGIMHRTIGELSRGLKQRAGIASAMISDPEILILDEPTAGLDPNQVAEIRDIIRDAGREKTVILSTHILSEAEAACNRIMIIDRGRIVADDATSALTRTAGGRAVIHLELGKADPAAAAALLGTVEGVETVEHGEGGEQGLFRCRLLCRAVPGLRERIYGKIRETDWVLTEFHQETQTLETIFRELTREA